MEEFRAIAIRLVNEQVPLGLVGGFDHAVRFGDGHCHGFFHNDVLAGAETGDGFVGVMARGSGQHDNVDAGHGQDMIQGRGGLAGKFAYGLIDAGWLGVDNADNAHVRAGSQHGDVNIPAGAAETDDGIADQIAHGRSIPL